jgi:hypothetical protein
MAEPAVVTLGPEETMGSRRRKPGRVHHPTCVVSNNGCSEGSPAGSTYYLYDNKLLWTARVQLWSRKAYGCSYSVGT